MKLDFVDIEAELKKQLEAAGFARSEGTSWNFWEKDAEQFFVTADISMPHRISFEIFIRDKDCLLDSPTVDVSSQQAADPTFLQRALSEVFKKLYERLSELTQAAAQTAFTGEL